MSRVTGESARVADVGGHPSERCECARNRPYKTFGTQASAVTSARLLGQLHSEQLGANAGRQRRPDVTSGLQVHTFQCVRRLGTLLGPAVAATGVQSNDPAKTHGMIERALALRQSKTTAVQTGVRARCSTFISRTLAVSQQPAYGYDDLSRALDEAATHGLFARHTYCA